jgi:hypothetical protein
MTVGAALVALSLLSTAIAAGTAGDPAELANAYDYANVAETSDTSTGAAGDAASTAPQTTDYYHFRMLQQKNSAIFAVALVLTAVVAHIATLFFLFRIRARASSMVSATGLIYVVFGTILVVVIANTEQQLTAAVGILGAVAGYLFGKTRGGDAADAEADAAAKRKVEQSP